MAKKKKVFAVLYHAEWESYPSASDILGIYDTREKAEHKMKSAIINAIADNTWSCDEWDTERKSGNDFISLYDNVGGIDYLKVSIVEREIE